MSFLFILASLYFFLPAYFANMTPAVLAKRNFFNFLAKRVDFGKKFLGKEIFGAHKTWRGVIFGIIMGVLIVGLQRYLYQFPVFKELSSLIFDYGQGNIFLFGFLMSSGAVFGDLLFAFIKRRLNLEPGRRFFPFDQINYIIGAILFLTPFFKIDIKAWITLLILTPILHVLTTQIGFRFGLTKSKW